MPVHVYTGPMVGLSFGYYMPYYGATYYATYNPYNYYGQGDPCLDRGACGMRPTPSPIGTIIGLICFCCIFALICVVVMKSRGDGADVDDGYVEQHTEVTTEVIHDAGTGLPNIQINGTQGYGFVASADWAAGNGGRLVTKIEMQDWIKYRCGGGPMYQYDVWVPVNSDDGDDWVSIGNNGTGNAFYETQGGRNPEWHDMGGGPTMIAWVPGN